MFDPPHSNRRTRKKSAVAAAVRLRNDGVPNVAIAERLGVRPETVCHYLRAGGIPGRGGGRYPRGFRVATTPAFPAMMG